MTGLSSLTLEEIAGLHGGRGCRLQSPSIAKKKDAVIEILKLLPINTKTRKFSLSVLVPESIFPLIVDMVSIVIGRGGNQIRQLQAKTCTDVYIDSNKMDGGVLHCVQITGSSISTLIGKNEDVAEACRRIYELIETRAVYAQANERAKEAVRRYSQNRIN